MLDHAQVFFLVHVMNISAIVRLGCRSDSCVVALGARTWSNELGPPCVKTAYNFALVSERPCCSSDILTWSLFYQDAITVP